ncbi:MAG: hypothetical protein HOJ16_06250 [Candidatus Peribacter sp.]|jgi:hypothetical protein|nr:hypothetical protein [Candidatus Peribacter sp.]
MFFWCKRVIEKGSENPNIFHLAGVIPVSGIRSDFGFPWHESLNPISQNYLAIERAVIECAYAGCETIWIVCDDDIQPLLKHRVGDYVVDPCSVSQASFTKFPKDGKRIVPVFYTPVHPKDRDRRDSLIWNAMHGMLSAFVTSSKISRWVVPSRYYVCFPYGVYDPSQLQKHRKVLSSPNRVVLTHESCNALNKDTYLGFSMSPEDYKNCVHQAKKSCTGNDKSLPIAKRWSSKDIGIREMMQGCVIDAGTVEVNVDWYFSIDNWQDYQYYFLSGKTSEIKRPSKHIFKNSTFKKLKGTDDELE